MHDAQNLFFKELSYSGDTWEADKTADKLISEDKIKKVIIIGIEHKNEERVSEYVHSDGFIEDRYYKSKGYLYEKFIINELKPYIKSSFNISDNKNAAALIGSSMGGLVSLHIAMNHPEVFGLVGAVSPSLWWDNASILKRFEKYDFDVNSIKLWLDMGTEEGEYGKYAFDAALILKERYKSQQSDFIFKSVEGADHTERAWSRRFDQVLEYLFSK